MKRRKRWKDCVVVGLEGVILGKREREQTKLRELRHKKTEDRELN